MGKTDTAETRASTLSAALSRTPAFLRQQLWLWPLVAAAMLVFVGVWVRSRMERAMEAQITSTLETTLDANTEALREWAKATISLAEVLAANESVRQSVEGLVRNADQQGTSTPALLGAPQRAPLHAILQPAAENRGFKGYVVLNTNLVILAATTDQIIGSNSTSERASRFQPCLAGEAVVTQPFASPIPIPDEAGNLQPGMPMMFVLAPIRSSEGAVMSVLGLRISPEKDFTRILATARVGRTGETYAFDRNGLLLSQSRFEEELKRLGLIPDSKDSRSVLTLQLRDPLVDLREGKQSPKRPSDQPLIKAVQRAIAGEKGVDARGYRDYRGARVAGAWTWLADFDMGLVTQQDLSEAHGLTAPIRIGLWILFGFLTAGSAVVYILMRVARRAALKATRFGQYSLDDEIGSGGFGNVFRGHHALMHRPVAVKVLSPLADSRAVARFEREVQLTCQLSHPNTIALYDYGHTPEGLFYYAMEYLEGLSLAELIEKYGPQPEARVIHILRQVCGSLAEAHSKGLVHRDIKPHNIFLTNRGGIADFVKVLDFGLVKARDLPDQVQITGANATLGTPLYMAPEAVRSPSRVDASSDIYSLGAVAYELLTGQTVFSGSTVGEVMVRQVQELPEKPSDRMKRPVSADLEELLMKCLEKKPAERPASAAALEEALGRCAASGAWTRQDAADWWIKFAAAQNAKTTVLPVT